MPGERRNSMLLIAHAGHWALTLLQASPLLTVPAVLICKAVRDRRGARGDGSLQTG